MDRKRTPHTLLHGLMKAFEQALRLDSWGQRLEAANEYDKFCMEYDRNVKRYSIDKDAEKQLTNIVECAKQRALLLQIEPQNQTGTSAGAVDDKSVGLEQLQSGIEVFQDILNEQDRVFLRRRSSAIAPLDQVKGYLLPAVKRMKPGFTYLTVKIEKIGLKEAAQLDAPYLTVSVRGADGTEIGQDQHTYPSFNVEDKYIIYNACYHLQKAIEELTEGFAIFFELKHYKEKKHKMSTKCYSFLEADEIRPGPAKLEL